ncbi:MAG: hypothetical protein P1V97_01150 [Planctomycetota bacterium]|nr:hypothetical protein [Planctomycetota bacterium]
MWIGLDDTDVLGSPGTNQLARQIAQSLHQFGLKAELVLRHQLLEDPRVPCTTQNGSASLIVSGAGDGQMVDDLWSWLVQKIKDFAPKGSDPALALTMRHPSPQLNAFGQRCKRQLVKPQDALALAAVEGVRLARLAGRDHGVVGALAAVGLAGGGNDGRVVHKDGWPWPDHFGGKRSIPEILERGIDVVQCTATYAPVHTGLIQIGKRLRPAWRDHRVVLLVEKDPVDGTFHGIKAP